jgi:hypothetical protein
MSQVLLFGRIKAPSPVGFEDFWQAYHPQRRVDKARARMEWVRMSPADQRAAIDAMPAHVQQWQAAGTEPQHIPHPSRWLKWRRWEDELPGQAADDAALIRACGARR